MARLLYQRAAEQDQTDGERRGHESSRRAFVLLRRSLGRRLPGVRLPDVLVVENDHPDALRADAGIVFPHRLDRWMFSDKWVPDDKWAYTSRSLAGQWHGDSDSWGPGGNANVGFVEEPPLVRRSTSAGCPSLAWKECEGGSGKSTAKQMPCPGSTPRLGREMNLLGGSTLRHLWRLRGRR